MPPGRRVLHATAAHFLTQVNDNCGRKSTLLSLGGVAALAAELCMSEKKLLKRPDHDLEQEALTALEEARAMPPGPERTQAMRKAGNLRNAADLLGVVFAKRGRPAKI